MTRSTHAVLILAVLFTAGCSAASAQTAYRADEKAAGPLVHRVQPADFVHDITQRCHIGSASSVDIRCEVKSGNTSGTTILYIVPEGTYVRPVPDWKPKAPDEEPPDLLVKLDSSALERELIQQEFVCAKSKSRLIQAQYRYDTAEINKKEYIEGSYKQLKLGKESKIFVTKEALRKAEDLLKRDRQQLAMGYVSELEVQADEFAVEKAKRDLEEAELDLYVLENYSYEKELNRLDSDIEIAKSELQTAQRSHDLDLEELEEVNTQMANCTIRAPEAGQVVYANVVDRRGGREIIIEEGTQVRERQMIIKLPDPKRMQAKATIDQAEIALVKKGMHATIRLDAFPDLELKGTVEKVNEYPESSSWFTGNVKKHETTIRIHEPPAGLRIGLTGELKIHVEQLSDVLQVPVQAVVEHEGKFYCLVRHGKGFEAREVTIGPTNDKFVVIRGGLKEGEEVTLDAAGRTAALEELLGDSR